MNMGQYRQVEVLGSTQYFELFSSIIASTQQKVMMKSFNDQHQSSANIKRLHNEYQLLQTLIHPNIIAAYAVEELAEKTYLIQEYFDSETLDKYLNNKPLALKNFLNLAIEICKIISFVHKKILYTPIYPPLQF